MDRFVRVTPGLSRLEAIAGERKHLFLGEHGARSGSLIHPRSLFADSDPERPRGWWIPGVGLIAPRPLVFDVFASHVVAALLAVTQSRGGNGVFRVDQLADGTVAMTVGENSTSQGVWAGVLREAARREDSEPLGDFFVNVLPRSELSFDENMIPLPGVFASDRAVRVEERVRLCAGDAWALARILRRRLPWMEKGTARQGPFAGALAVGGHIQFSPLTGEVRDPPRLPTLRDRVAALQYFQRQGRRWVEGEFSGSWLLLPDNPRDDRDEADLPLAPRYASGAIETVLTFIDQNCTRAIEVADMAAVAQMSASRLHAVFRSEVGVTPLAYVADRRLDLAERLLADTRLTIAEISERCGFAEQGSLTRSLRKRRGLTPSDLRRSRASAQRDE